jgi:hypothetical protein
LYFSVVKNKLYLHPRWRCVLCCAVCKSGWGILLWPLPPLPHTWEGRRWLLAVSQPGSRYRAEYFSLKASQCPSERVDKPRTALPGTMVHAYVFQICLAPKPLEVQWIQ